MAIVWTQNILGKWIADGNPEISLSWEQIYHNPHMRANFVASGQLHSAYLNRRSPAEEKYELTGWTGQPRDINFPQTPQAITQQPIALAQQAQAAGSGEVNSQADQSPVSPALLLAGALAVWFLLRK